MLSSSGLAYSYQKTTIETMPGIVVEGTQHIKPTYDEVTTTPYRSYTVSLIIISVALFAVGIVIMFLQFLHPVPKK